MSYRRVIPRDLFNESKLLKCLGRLSLLIHDRVDGLPLTFKQFEDGDPFDIEQDPSSGNLFCPTLRLGIKRNASQAYRGTIWVLPYTAYNSKMAYPLYLNPDNTDEILVLNEDGTYTDDFKSLVLGIAA